MLYPITDEDLSRLRGKKKPHEDWAEIVPELGPKEGDIVITKHGVRSTVRSLSRSKEGEGLKP